MSFEICTIYLSCIEKTKFIASSLSQVDIKPSLEPIAFLRGLFPTKNTRTRTLFVFCSKKQRLAIIMVLLKLRKAIGSKLSFFLYFHMLLKLGGKTDQNNSSSNHTREIYTGTGIRLDHFTTDIQWYLVPRELIISAEYQLGKNMKTSSFILHFTCLTYVHS